MEEILPLLPFHLQYRSTFSPSTLHRLSHTRPAGTLCAAELYLSRNQHAVVAHLTSTGSCSSTKALTFNTWTMLRSPHQSSVRQELEGPGKTGNCSSASPSRCLHSASGDRVLPSHIQHVILRTITITKPTISLCQENTVEC